MIEKFLTAKNVHRMFFLWTVVIVVGTLAPGSKDKGLLDIPHIDKAIHFIFFAIWGSLFSLLLRAKTDKDYVISPIVIFVGLMLALMTEYLQTYVAFRHGDVYDFAADALGLGIGLAVTNKLKLNVLNV